MTSENLEIAVEFETPRTLEAFHEAQETLEDVGEVDQEPLEAHEVRETPLEHEKLVKVAGIRRKILPEEGMIYLQQRVRNLNKFIEVRSQKTQWTWW